MVCAETPEPFSAVGQWYDDFSQTTDEEVRQLLEASRRENPGRKRRRARSDVPKVGGRSGKGAFDF